jgi:hypothetical protein
MRGSFQVAFQGAERIVSWIIENEGAGNKVWFLLLLVFQVQAAPKQHEYCAVCHKETVQDFLAHPHFQKGMECRVCHGESTQHRTSEGHAEPDRIAAPHEIPALCGGCHQGKGTVPILAEYSASKHGQLVLAQAKTRSPHCGTCHGVHTVRDAKAIEAQCGRCHAQRPAACSTTASCVTCHTPHNFPARK